LLCKKKCYFKMDELPLVVDGIESKIKRLLIQIDQLKTKNSDLNSELSGLKEIIIGKDEEIIRLKQELQTLKVAKTLENGDSFQAKQKINDLLREIDKCYSLLNR